MTTHGYLYIANGRVYVDEALNSVASLRRVEPEAHVTLVTGEPFESPLFDRVIVEPFEVDSWKSGLLYKVRHMYASSPYDRTFFVDSDTYFCDSCRELFHLLDFYDLCITDAQNDCSEIRSGNGVLRGYFPYCTGIMVFRKSDANRQLFQSWLEIYETKMSQYQHDQGPLAEALLNATAKLYVARNIYNAKLNYHVSYMASKVKIIHGRADDYEAVRKALNSTPVNRSWDPISRQCGQMPAIRYVKAYAKYLRRMFARPHD